MPEIEELFTLATSDFETADTYFKETQDVLYALKAKLQDCSERLAKLAHDESQFYARSDKPPDNSQPPDGNGARDAAATFDAKLEVCFKQLAKLAKDKSAGGSALTTNRKARHKVSP